jgi:hypothetical protein
MAKPKAVQADNDAPRGHNSAKDEQDRKVLFFIGRKNYLAALAEKKAADAKLKNVAKTIKADLGEYGLDQIKAYEVAQTPEGQAKLKAEMEATAQAMRFAGMAINTQADMFEDLAPLVDRAYAMGEEAGLRGDTLSNPYNEGSPEGQQYASGWHAGQGALFEGIKKIEAKAADELIKGPGEDPFPEEDLQAAE